MRCSKKLCTERLPTSTILRTSDTGGYSHTNDPRWRPPSRLFPASYYLARRAKCRNRRLYSFYAGARTMTRRRCSRASSGSAAKPVWTGEGCTTVLRGATSQPKRWLRGRRPMGPASRPPAHTRRAVSRWASTRAWSRLGSSAARRSGSRCTRAPRKFSSGQCSTTPALMNSPRSTRGTTRKRAYSNSLLTSLLQRLRPGPRFRKAGREVIDVGRAHLLRALEAGLVPEPLVGDELHHLAQRLPGEQGGQDRVGQSGGLREGEQDVVAGRCVGSLGRDF